MTLVAAYFVGKTPILISDFLLSSLRKGREHEAVPTYVNVDKALPPDWEVRVAGLARKSAIINDKFAVAGAGSTLLISTFFKLLFAEFHNSSPTRKELQSFFQNNNDLPSGGLNCVIVGWIVENESPVSFKYSSNQMDELQFGDVYIEGSGCDLFKNKVWVEEATNWGAIDTEIALKHCLERLAVLMANEVVGGHSISNRFGGGYDLIFYDGECFRTIDEVTYLILNSDMITFSENGNIPRTEAIGDDVTRNSSELGKLGAPILFKTGYAEEFPIIRAVIPKNNQVGSDHLDSERIIVIEPLATKDGKGKKLSRVYHTDDFPYFSKYLMVVIFGVNRTGASELFIAAVRDGEARAFKLNSIGKDGKVKFYFPIDIMDSILSAAKKQFLK